MGTKVRQKNFQLSNFGHVQLSIMVKGVIKYTNKSPVCLEMHFVPVSNGLTPMMWVMLLFSSNSSNLWAVVVTTFFLFRVIAAN